MTGRTFVSIVLAGIHRGYDGRRVRHITDAFCRICGFTYGRGDVRDDVSGHVHKDMPIVTNEQAAAAARALGLPLEAALFGEAIKLAEAEAAQAVQESPEPTPANDLDSFLRQSSPSA